MEAAGEVKRPLRFVRTYSLRRHAVGLPAPLTPPPPDADDHELLKSARLTFGVVRAALRHALDFPSGSTPFAALNWIRNQVAELRDFVGQEPMAWEQPRASRKRRNIRVANKPQPPDAAPTCDA